MRTRRYVPLLAIVLIGAHDIAIGEVTVIHAGWLLASPGNQPIERQSIIIENGRVSAVRSGFIDLTDPAVNDTSARFVDLSQAFVLPGLIDSHVHLASSPGAGDFGNELSRTEADLALTASRHAQLTLQAGFTTVVDLGGVGNPGHENAIFGVRDAVKSGALAGPRILSAGTPIAATGLERAASYRDEVMAAIDLRSVCDGADDCRRAVRHEVKRGADIIVFFNTGSLLSSNPVPKTMTDAEMTAIVETAHSLGRKVIADGHHAPGIAAALRAGADIIDSAHLYDDDTFRLLGSDVFFQSHIYGVVMAVGDTEETLHNGLWGWLPEPILLRFQAIRRRPFAMIEAYDHGIRNLAYASDAGVYTWGNNAGDFPEFVARGMSQSDAIMTATVNAARMLGLEDDLGSIEKGKKADIIATAGNPLDDIAELMRIHFVMRDGVVYRINNQRSTTEKATPGEFSP